MPPDTDTLTVDASFDHHARLVQRLLGVPTGLVTFIEPDRQVFAGAVGLPEPWQTTREAPLSHSFCQYVVRDGTPFIVTDAHHDERVSGSPAITELRVVAYAGWPLSDHTGAVVGSLCAIDDRPRVWTETELSDLADLAAACSAELTQRALAGELAAAVSELRRSNTQLTAFAAQVSHDLRNPLSALSSSLQLLERAGDTEAMDPEVTHRLLARARKSAHRMSELVNSVLAFAVVGGQLAVEEVDVASVLASVLDDLYVAQADTGTEIEVGEVVPVHADPLQLRIVLQNLLANALKHAAGSSVEVTSAVEGDRWVLSVVDHGPGIPAGERGRVLEPFVRLDPRVTGSGLGLATCVRIAEAHGGSIALVETPGGGTTALLRLPRSARD